MVEDYLKGVSEHGLIPQYEAVCNSSNNPEEAIQRGELTVDLIFHGSLAQAVRDKMARYENAKSATSEAQCPGS